MRRLNNKKVKSNWVTFPSDESLRLNIRPLDILSMTKPPTEVTTSVTEIYEWFNYILIDWEGFVDEDNNPLECNEDNKKLIYMYDQEVAKFCIEQATELRGTVVTKDAENLKKLQGGEVANSAEKETAKTV